MRAFRLGYLYVGRIAFFVFGGMLSIYLLFAGTLLYLSWPISEYSVSKAGVFGDSFGAISSLFSGLAFAGLIITILLQQAEMKALREIYKNLMTLFINCWIIIAKI